MFFVLSLPSIHLAVLIILARDVTWLDGAKREGLVIRGVTTPPNFTRAEEKGERVLLGFSYFSNLDFR